MNETDLMNEIRMFLSQQGHVVFRANVGKVKLFDGRWFDTGLPKGFSDLFSVNDGKVYFWEVKVRPNKPSIEQLNFLHQMTKKGCCCGVVYSLEEVNKLIKGER